MKKEIEYKEPCPCCGYITLQAPGDDEFCRICLWQNSISQLRFPKSGGGANRASLVEAQQNYQKFGASEERRLPRVSAPTPITQRDLGWHPISLENDNIEEQVSGVDYGSTYPRDLTTLYYWRDTYWRK